MIIVTVSMWPANCLGRYIGILFLLYLYDFMNDQISNLLSNTWHFPCQETR